MEPKEVCKICYNSTSHKPTPTLTYEPKQTSDDGTAPPVCAVCRQEWAPIRVAKELGSNRWVRIRPRPKLQMHIDFAMCKNLKSRAECPRGQDCSYAHSQAELWAWNQERQKEPRPAPRINGSYQYQLCKYISKSGNCPYGNKCTFAHNEEELQAWLKVQGVMPGSGSSSIGNLRSSSSGYKCNVCHVKCNSKKQLEEHLTHSRHRQQQQGGGAGAAARQQTGSSANRYTSRGASNGQPRPRPTLSFQIAGFRLCVHVQNGRRCLYGDYCTFAHSQAELDEWNQLPKGGSTSSTRSYRNESGLSQQSSSTTGPTAAEKPAPMHNGTKEEFSSSARREMGKDQKGDGVAAEMEASGREGVSVKEVTGTQLALTTTTGAAVSWVFEVTTLVAHTLQSVVLLDTLHSDFDVFSIERQDSSSGWEKVPVQGSAEQGVGMLLNYKLLPSDKLHVKVSVRPRSGLLGQVVVFQFGSFRISKCLVLRVVSESEEKLRKLKSHPAKRPANVDMFWENHYNKIGLENSFEEELDRHLPEYLLPQQIEALIEKGKYSNVENRVTKENYKRRMHNLLYLEEYQQRVDLSRYDLYDVEIKPQSQYGTGLGAINYARKGYHFITLSIDELLFEGGQSVRQGDSALLLPSNQQVMHECPVEHVGKESIVLKITEKAKQASAASRFRVSVRFLLGRVTMRGMHYAVDQLDLDTIFPDAQNALDIAIPSSSDVQDCLDVLKDSELSDFQRQAIASMLDSSCQKIPSLVLGPFGCGKTRTLSECIAVMARHMPRTRVLVCTHSNSAADIYVENLDACWAKHDGKALSMFRLYYTMRRLSAISTTVKKYCKISRDQRLLMPSLAEIKTYRIVVATLSTARALPLMDLSKGHFTHIFIDEAAQALESEALIPLCLANSQTKIVLAGDHMQLDPPVYSDIARKYGLHVSLLERLYDLEAYESGVGQLCKTLLTENHRSHHLILDLPSQLFYKNKLTCKAKFPAGGPVHLPAVKFVAVDGQEEQDEDSPSYFNNQEAIKVAEEVKLLTEAEDGLRGQDICVITYYSRQVHRLRNYLRNQQLGQVQVHRVDNVQGKEFRALIISTVRTSATEPDSEKEAGFLTNPKLFNTAVTRARQWLIVVGEPVTLCTIGSNRRCWLEYIRRCIGLKSFDHPQPSQFISRLDYKMVTRQLMEKTFPTFFKSARVQRGSVPKTISAATSQQSTFEPSKRPLAPQQQEGEFGMEDTKLSLRSRTFASKVLDSDVLGKEMGMESSGLNQVVPRVKLSELANHSMELSTKQDSLSPQNPTSPLMNHSRRDSHDSRDSLDPREINLEGLPIFLSNVVDSLKFYSGWCEEMLAASYPLKISSKVNSNLQRQKSLLEQQTKIVQEQIQLYRDYMKLTSKDSKNGAGVQAGVQADISASQQLHFPSALPPPITHTLSAGLNSTFSYDAVGNYFANESRQSSTSQGFLKD